MDAALRNLVRQRAGNRCEYCRVHQDDDPFYTFHVDHIIAEQHRGSTVASNLALSCYRCNLHKGTNLASIDPMTGELVALFHPRRNRWPEHFAWDGPRIIGQTPIGRATVHVLAMNVADYVVFREALIAEGLYPPSD